MSAPQYWEVVLSKVRDQERAEAEERRIDDKHIGLAANVLSAAKTLDSEYQRWLAQADNSDAYLSALEAVVYASREFYKSRDKQ